MHSKEEGVVVSYTIQSMLFIRLRSVYSRCFNRFFIAKLFDLQCDKCDLKIADLRSCKCNRWLLFQFQSKTQLISLFSSFQVCLY